MSCVGAARCEQSCYDEAIAQRAVVNTFLDDMHRPALPYKFKFKFSGCPNDCMNSIQRADMAVIGTWRDNMRSDEALARQWLDKHGMNELVNDVVARCPTKAIQLKEAKDLRSGPEITAVKVSDLHALEIDNKDCVRCMHCINVMTGALAPGKDKGASILVGGKSHLKIGDSITESASFLSDIGYGWYELGSWGALAGASSAAGFPIAAVNGVCDEACRAIVLCSSGRVFCGGVDFRSLGAGGPDASPEPLYRLAQRLLAGRKPCIAAVQGAAVGAGLGLDSIDALELALVRLFPLAPRDAVPVDLGDRGGRAIGEARVALDAEHDERREDQQHQQALHQARMGANEIEHGSGPWADRCASA